MAVLNWLELFNFDSLAICRPTNPFTAKKIAYFQIQLRIFLRKHIILGRIVHQNSALYLLNIHGKFYYDWERNEAVMASQVTRGRDRRLILLLRIVCFRVIHELFCSDLRVDYVKSLYKSLVMNNYMAMRQISGCTSAKIDHLSIYFEQYVSGL